MEGLRWRGWSGGVGVERLEWRGWSGVDELELSGECACVA